MKDLQTAKSNTWEERKKRSRQYEEERKTNLANKVRDFALLPLTSCSVYIQVLLMNSTKFCFSDGLVSSICPRFTPCFQGILEWVMDTVRKGNKEAQERIILLQKEKDQVSWKDEKAMKKNK